jgi:ATP-dependent Clp protease adaptor protein ClpS
MPLFEVEAAYVRLFVMIGQDGVIRPEGAQRESTLEVIPLDIFSSTSTAPTIEKSTESEEALDVPWQVVVHNDPVNLMTYVTMVFQRVFGYPREKAERHMLEVHHRGRSVLWSGVRERAELYVQQLHGYLLLATLEKVN